MLPAAAMSEEEVPESLEVPEADVGRIIGPNGSTLKRVIQATGCRIEVLGGPKRDTGLPAAVRLAGSVEQRRLAVAAIKDIVAGGDAEDHAARADGAMVLTHGLEDFERRSWAAWRLIPVEHENGVRVDMGRKAMRIWASSGRRGLLGPAAEKLMQLAKSVVAEAKELHELSVDCPLDYEPEHAGFDAAVRGLVDQHGLLVRAPLPEDGRVALRLVGPVEAVRDAALMLEARFVKGKSTASILQVPGQVQAMAEQMMADFTEDLRALEADSQVKVHLGHTALWLSGANAEAVCGARETLREMLQFYLPEGFSFRPQLKPQAFVDKLRQDEKLRTLAAHRDVAMALDRQEETAWLCGGKEQREAILQRIEELWQKWASEHWEVDLDNYGVAMWLLGPSGTGQWLGRMQAESGATIKVCPNSLKVWVEGAPPQVEAGSRLVLEGLERLKQKQREDQDVPIREVATKNAKSLLTEHPPHMTAILEGLRLLEARELEARRRARMRELQRSRSRSPRTATGRLPQATAGAGGERVPASALQQQDQQQQQQQQVAEGEGGAVEAVPQEEQERDLFRGLRQRVATAALLPQLMPKRETSAAGVGRTPEAAPADAAIHELSDGEEGGLAPGRRHSAQP